MKTLALALVALLLSCRIATAAVQEIVLLTRAKADSPQRVVADAFKELIERQAGESFTVLIDPAGLRSGESKAVEEVQTNTAQLAVLPASAFERFDPVVRVAAFPFLFRDEQQAAAILDGPLGKGILRDLETIGCKGLTFAEGGFRHLSNNIRPVKTLDDLKDLKIRIPTQPGDAALWLTLGANPMPRPWPIYAELEQGAFDGQESPLWMIDKYSLHTVQRHLSLTRHSYVAHIAVASLKWWNALSPTDQARLQAAMTEAAARQRLVQRDREAARLALFAQKGMAIEAHPDIETFRARTAKLKETVVYREPRLQALLTKMLESAREPTQEQAQPTDTNVLPAKPVLAQEPPVQPNAPQPASTTLPPAPEADAPLKQANGAATPEAGQPAPQENTDHGSTALELLDAEEPLSNGLQAPAEAASSAQSDSAPTPAPIPDDAPARREHAEPAAN